MPSFVCFNDFHFQTVVEVIVCLFTRKVQVELLEKSLSVSGLFVNKVLSVLVSENFIYFCYLIIWAQAHHNQVINKIMFFGTDVFLNMPCNGWLTQKPYQ